MGYYGTDNRTVIDIPRCPLAAEPINRDLERLRGDRDFRQSLEEGGEPDFPLHSPLTDLYPFGKGRSRNRPR